MSLYYFEMLLEQGFKVALLQLQQELIDKLPNDYDVEIINTDGHRVNNGIYLTVSNKRRKWSVKPSDAPGKMFLLIKNGDQWDGPYPIDTLTKAMADDDMSEAAYRALIVDNEWRSKASPRPKDRR